MRRMMFWLSVLALMFVVSACDDEEAKPKQEKPVEETQPKEFKQRVDDAKLIETSTDGTLTVAEAHVEADKKVEQLKANFLSAFDDSVTSVVQKVNLNSDEYPEIIHLKNLGDESRLQIIRYIVDSEYYSEKNQWVIIYSKTFKNLGGVEPVKHFGNMKFSPNGIDYPVFGSVMGNNQLLVFGIYGIGEKENVELVVNRMSQGYPQGKLTLDNTKEYKLTVTSYGTVVETITEKDIKQ